VSLNGKHHSIRSKNTINRVCFVPIMPYLNYVERADKIPFPIDSVTFLTRKRKGFRRNHLTENPETTFERACQRKEKQTLGSCGENALEERRRLSDRAANKTFATSVRRTLRSSTGRQFLQAGSATIQGIVLDEARGLPGERWPVRLPAFSLLVDALSRHYRFSTGHPCARRQL